MPGGDPCAVCGRPIAGSDPRRVTCGHPRCRREYAARRGKRPPELPTYANVNKTAPDVRALIARLMMGATNGGVPSSTAVLSVAKATGETPAVVASVWSAMQPDIAPTRERR